MWSLVLRLLNCGYQAFLRYAQGKTVYVYGAGRAMESCLRLYFAEQDVAAIVDGNPQIQGTAVQHHGQAVEIVGPEALAAMVAEHGTEEALLMITSQIYAAEIVAALDRVPVLDGLACFVQAVIRETLEPVPSFRFTQGASRIPKKLHYIWIGGKPLPEKYRKYIETWRKHNPDFEVFQWDESNYDIHRYRYLEQAYEQKGWNYVSNLMRLDIIYRYGGIYFDTDVEVRQSLKPLLADRAFFGMATGDRVSTGCGFGAAPGEPILRTIIEEYEARPFVQSNGKTEHRLCSTFLISALRQYGFRPKNAYQKIRDVVIYPVEVFSPLRQYGRPDMITDRTMSIHWEDNTWLREKEKGANQQMCELISRMETIE